MALNKRVIIEGNRHHYERAIFARPQPVEWKP